MHDLEHHTRAVRQTDRLRWAHFTKAIRTFQKACGKDRPLEKYIAEWSEKRNKRVNGPRLFVLVVNEVVGGGTLTCPDCHARMQGNGRSIKYVVDWVSISPRQQAEVVYVILCPQECCPCCRKAGVQYCHKIIPCNTAYWLRLFSCRYEAGICGDADGRCPLGDSTLVRHGRRLATVVAALLRCPPECIRAAVRQVFGASGFEAVTAAVSRLVQCIWGSVPPRGWYSGLVTRWYLRRCRDRTLS